MENYLDAREISMVMRLPRVLQAVNSLNSGDSLILVNDQDPKPLKLKLSKGYTWEYLETGPQVFKVKITKD